MCVCVCGGGGGGGGGGQHESRKQGRAIQSNTRHTYRYNVYACVHVYLRWCRKSQHGVQLKELYESGHELVVGDHLNQALAVCLALVGEHAGGCGRTG